ncbi:MAG: MerR family transcriptional regulator [Clostridiales bacterium]|jgi:DNA-binding transcriptional MerR regulator|nr:MerR family transcriptional regulator [Eubacteriales bacterium]MDH7566595.1 MerR family transcriptional regulator [Clostridiales bacterium]
MKYKIAEFAGILGVTADTLRLYEKYGIIKPVKDEKNHYRYFHDLDARNLLRSRWYRSLHIPLPDVAQLTNDATLNSIICKFEEKEIELENEIKKYQRLLAKIRQIHQECDNIESSLRRCCVQQAPSIYRLRQTDKVTFVHNQELHSIISEWMNLLPFAFFSLKIAKSSLLDESAAMEYDWGIAITEDEARDFNLGISEHVDYYPSRKCVSTVVKAPDNLPFTVDAFKYMFEYIDGNGFSICGDALGKHIVAEKSNNTINHYISIQIPIE